MALTEAAINARATTNIIVMDRAQFPNLILIRMSRVRLGNSSTNWRPTGANISSDSRVREPDAHSARKTRGSQASARREAVSPNAAAMNPRFKAIRARLLILRARSWSPASPRSMSGQKKSRCSTINVIVSAGMTWAQLLKNSGDSAMYAW